MARIVRLDDNGELRVAEAATNGAHEVTVKAPASLAADYDFILPTAAPGSTLYLTMSATGQLATASGSSGTLDEAYDSGGAGNGRTINVTAGAVQLVGDASSDTLELKDAAPSLLLTLTGVTHRNVRLNTGADTFAIQRGDDDADGTNDTFDDVLLMDTENRRVALGVATAPASVLHVLSGSAGGASPNAAALVTVEAVAGADSVVQLLTDAAQAGRLLFGDQADDDIGYVVYDHSDNHLALGANAADRLTILSTGYVGLGQVTPTRPLEVYHATENFIAHFESGDSGVAISLADSESSTPSAQNISVFGDDLGIQTANTTRLTVLSTGEVGIGDTTPTGLLDISYDHATQPALQIRQDGVAAQISASNAAGVNFTLNDGQMVLGTAGTTAAAELSLETATGGTATLAFNDGADDGKIVYSHTNRRFLVTAGGLAYFSIDEDGHVGIGDTAAPTGPSYSISILSSGTGLSGTPSSAGLYAASGELIGYDTAGNTTILTPHDFSRFQPSEKMAWCYSSQREGTAVWVDMLQALRELEKLSGKSLVKVFTVGGPDDPGPRDPQDWPWEQIPGLGARPPKPAPEEAL